MVEYLIQDRSLTTGSSYYKTRSEPQSTEKEASKLLGVGWYQRNFQRQFLWQIREALQVEEKASIKLLIYSSNVKRYKDGRDNSIPERTKFNTRIFNLQSVYHLKLYADF